MGILLRGAIALVALATAAPLWAETALPVEIVTATTTSQSASYQLAGTIEAPDTVSAAFRDGGRVISVAVSAGDSVAQGDELARVDASQAEAARDSAAAALSGAEAALTEAKTAQARMQARLEGGVATRAELDNANQGLAAAQAARDQAQATLAKAQRAVDDTVLRAPQDAIVTARSLEVGQVVGPGQGVLTLASRDRRVGVFYAPDTVDVDAFIGETIRLSLINKPDVHLSARVSEVSPLVDPKTGTVRVRAKIADPPSDQPLLGVPVLAELDYSRPPAIHLPWDALTATADGPAVWTVDPATMRAKLTSITVESYSEGEIAVASGLSDGALVVGAGSQLLYPGRLVTAAGGAQ
ncbi:MAG: efflux RND transporter periplasmic adaptor subunit [Limimaricola sp.]|uniref:efflux RND transporter periplasmic adaptor subunit n=1 Tax=Limimaricola sp. TaxID=2211665 RepID=UPI001D25A6BC|nr:efflux RND transporter periplasmic adaptor subunit [Limimaricola sp.]MBI1418602.1 efflux RND transporter periplasmic adaptor subunit [Limimaricola sp.]